MVVVADETNKDSFCIEMWALTSGQNEMRLDMGMAPYFIIILQKLCSFRIRRLNTSS